MKKHPYITFDEAIMWYSTMNVKPEVFDTLMEAQVSIIQAWYVEHTNRKLIVMVMNYFL